MKMCQTESMHIRNTSYNTMIDTFPRFVQEFLGKENWEQLTNNSEYQDLIISGEKYGDVIFKELVDLISNLYSWPVRNILHEFSRFKKTNDRDTLLC